MKDLRKLIEAARDGEQDAYHEIVVRFRDMAVGYAYALLQDFHLAEDAAQEAFLEAFLSLRALREPAAFSRWLKMIIFKHCDRMTRAKRVPVEEAPLEGLATDGHGPERQAEASELRRTVLAAINALGEKERAATALFYIDGYSHGEIADFLEASVPVVKSRLHRARGRLKGRLMKMVENVLKESAPDDSFNRKVAEAIEVFAAKGPPEDHMRSEWYQRWSDRGRELLRRGDQSFRLAVALSYSESARVRRVAALHLGLRRDPEWRPHLERLLDDRNGRVRGMALRQFASLIHPNRTGFLWAAAEQTPGDVERLVTFVDDANAEVRCAAVVALGAYAHLGDDRVGGALRTALQDRKHKVRHKAAAALQVVCPGCETRPPSHWTGQRSQKGVSEWQNELHHRVAQSVSEGGHTVTDDLRLSESPKCRDRQAAAVRLAVREDAEAHQRLKHMLEDRSASVRRQALYSYAGLIHPSRQSTKLWAVGTAAASVPDGIEAVLPMLHDRNVKNRLVAVAALGDYAALNDPRIEGALRDALDDEHHKVQHEAATHLGTSCPVCTSAPA